MIHFIHITPRLAGESALTRGQLAIVDGWRVLNPGWGVTVWTNSLMRRRLAYLVPLLERIPVPAWASDVARYHILEMEGGLYLDTDVLALRPVSALVAAHSPFGVCEWGVKNCKKNPQTVQGQAAPRCINRQACNNVIASPPGGRAVAAAANRSAQRSLERLDAGQETYDVQLTGPMFWSAVLEDTKTRVLCANTFNPCSFKLRGQCNASKYPSEFTYGMHLWAATWKGIGGLSQMER